jgi:hypothetical protein
MFLDLSNFTYKKVKDKGYSISDFHKGCDIITNEI